MKMITEWKAVADWKEAWRWFSVRALAAITAIPFVWVGLPEDAKAFIPEGWGVWIFAALGAAGILGRVTDQDKDRA